MTLKIVITVMLGIISGYFVLPKNIINYTDYIIDFGLILLLFFVGIDIGLNKSVFSRIKEKGIRILLVPFAIISGSILGSAIAGVILKLPFNEAGAIGAGLGWYSLSSILIASYSNELSALAFISNVIRELIAIMSIPLIAKKIGFMEAIAPAGATAMDTSLPIISKSTDSEITLIAFITGAICTFAVPILVPFILNL
jgi:uncharacterized membrane protein YbjE (DUF340 family)